MENELHNKSLKELREIYPNIKSTSKAGFIKQLESATHEFKYKKETQEEIDARADKLDKAFEDAGYPTLNEGETIEMVLESSKQIQSQGLGDTIEKVLASPAIAPITKAIKKVIFKDGEDCGCKERKVFLNQKFKYKLKPRCLTEQEHKEWGKFAKNLTLKIEDKQIKYICKLYSEVMQRQYFEPCRNCSPKPLIYMIDNLNVVYDSYK
jgi:hypothetical protein